jgi:hypothetical protein
MDAEAGSPMITAYEFADVSKVERPHAITKVQARNPPYDASLFWGVVKCAVGQKNTAPVFGLVQERQEVF